MKSSDRPHKEGRNKTRRFYRTFGRASIPGAFLAYDKRGTSDVPPKHTSGAQTGTVQLPLHDIHIGEAGYVNTGTYEVPPTDHLWRVAFS